MEIYRVSVSYETGIGVLCFQEQKRKTVLTFSAFDSFPSFLVDSHILFDLDSLVGKLMTIC